MSVSVKRVRVEVLADGRMNRINAARYIGHDVATLAKWQTQRKGPRSIKVGGRRFYFQQDLDAYIAGEGA
jgi:hypothetical protein